METVQMSTEKICFMFKCVIASFILTADTMFLIKIQC